MASPASSGGIQRRSAAQVMGSCPTGPYLGGNLSRNQYAGPAFREFDFSVIKNIPITERVKAQFRVEMFNLV